MALQKAHWYNKIVPSDSDLSREEINGIFPPLPSLLNTETAILQKVLRVCRLCQKKRQFLPILQFWTKFIAEYKIDVKLTKFSIGKKCYHFLQIGSFNKMSHPPYMPVFY